VEEVATVLDAFEQTGRALGLSERATVQRIAREGALPAWISPARAAARRLAS
jgi:hypothetical protein